VLETSLPPDVLLTRLQEIESRLGRTRGERWGPRTLDLDLLLFDELVLDTPQLKLPHPRMHFRRFVLQPAVEIAADMRHPLTGWTVQRLWEHLSAAIPYLAIAGAPGSNSSELAAEIVQQCGARLISDSHDELAVPLRGDGPEEVAPIESARLARWRSLLSRETWTDQQQLAVSDFWFDQALAFAFLRLPPLELRRFVADWKQQREQIVKPKLVLWLDAPASWLAQQVPATAPTENPEKLIERFRGNVAAQIRQPVTGPWLKLDPRDRPAALEEALAAI